MLEKLIQVYSRPGCHLCEQLIEELLPIIRGKAQLEVMDIDTNPEWSRKYGSRIPVVEYDERVVCQYSLDVRALRRLLDTSDSDIDAS